MPSFLALNAFHRSIGGFLIGAPVQSHPHRKTGPCVVSNDLDAANRLASRPLPNCVQTFFSESRVIESDRTRHHAA
jgi:hypothetical protein